MSTNDRGLDSTTKGFLDNAVVYPVWLFELNFDSASARLASGLKDIKFDSDGDGSDETFVASSDIVKFDPAQETKEIQSRGSSIVISGIPSDNLNLALQESYQNRSAKVWLGFLDASNSLQTTITIFSGLMDQMVIEEGPEASTIEIKCESLLVDLKNRNHRNYTDGDQRNFVSSNDNAFSYVGPLQNKVLTFGGTEAFKSDKSHLGSDY